MATELSTLGGSIQDYIGSLCKSIDIVVSQRKLEDGSRHVMKIEELTGKIDGSGSAETRVLFQFVLTGEVDKTEGKVNKIGGYFEQVNAISEGMLQKFYSAGISKEELNRFTEVSALADGYKGSITAVEKPAFL